jgi:hypothetical protein
VIVVEELDKRTRKRAAEGASGADGAKGADDGASTSGGGGGSATLDDAISGLFEAWAKGGVRAAVAGAAAGARAGARAAAGGRSISMVPEVRILRYRELAEIIQDWAHANGHGHLRLNRPQVLAMMQLIDQDRNGLITLSEFAGFCQDCLRQRELERDADTAVAVTAEGEGAAAGVPGHVPGAKAKLASQGAMHPPKPVGSTRRLGMQTSKKMVL